MNKVVAAILFLCSATLASAQETPEVPSRGFPMQTFTMCDTVDKMIAVLQNYDEVPMIKGQGSMFVQGGQQLLGEMMFWYNQETKSFTITLSNGQFMCMLTSGKDLEPMSIGDPL